MRMGNYWRGIARMKIIKSGIKPGKQFTCHYCGCVFLAEQGEYKFQENSQRRCYYEADCPECGHTVEVDC